jgi:hypothetical protein
VLEHATDQQTQHVRVDVGELAYVQAALSDRVLAQPAEQVLWNSRPE